MDRDRTGTSWAGAFCALLGFWLLGSILLFPMASGVTPSPQALWNDFAVGALVIIAGINAITSRSVAPFWWEVLLGVWLFASPLVLRYPDYNEGWNAMLVGLALIVLAGCAGATRHAGQAARRQRHF